jgi:hypothetical protein
MSLAGIIPLLAIKRPPDGGLIRNGLAFALKTLAA